MYYLVEFVTYVVYFSENMNNFLNKNIYFIWPQKSFKPRFKKKIRDWVMGKKRGYPNNAKP